jgi:hypothetical protein
MSKKNYRALAEAIRRATPLNVSGDGLTVAWIVRSITDALEADSGYDVNGNRRFQRDTFLDACGFGGVS